MSTLIISFSNTGVALPSATNSLSGGLKPLSEEDEANYDPKAEDKLMIETGISRSISSNNSWIKTVLLYMMPVSISFSFTNYLVKFNIFFIVSDGDKKIKRKYNKRTKKSSIFSFDGFDNISQDSPNSS